MTSLLKVLDYYGIEYENSSNDRYKALCPFHKDHDPSLVIYTEDVERHSYCCYVCNASGDATWFIRQVEKEDNEAIKDVIANLGITTKPIKRIKFINFAEVNSTLSIEYRELGKSQPHLYSWIDEQFRLLDLQILEDPKQVLKDHITAIKEKINGTR